VIEAEGFGGAVLLIQWCLTAREETREAVKCVGVCSGLNAVYRC
jgi:hypothetical protein